MPVLPLLVAAGVETGGVTLPTGDGEVVQDVFARRLIDAEVKRVTAHLAQYESIKRFALLPRDFTFDDGSLTFTLKLKRRVVEAKYQDVIEGLYADAVEPRPHVQA